MSDVFDLSVGGYGFHITSHLIAIAALFIACFAIAGYINFRNDSIPVRALDDGRDGDHLTIPGDLTVGGTLNTNGGLVTNGVPQPEIHSFLYDFAALGGARGTLTLTALDGTAKSLPRGFVATTGYVEVTTSVNSNAGNVTFTVGAQGTSNDADGFVVVGTGTQTNLAANAVIPFDGELVNNDGTAARKIITTNDPVSVTIAAEDATAGRFIVHVMGFQTTLIA